MNKVVVNNGDAVEYMYAHRQPKQRFDVVDLDPWNGCAFSDGAVQAVADGGLICCTCTDMAVLMATSRKSVSRCTALWV